MKVMVMVVVVAALAAATGCISPVIPIGGPIRSAGQVERDELAKLMPAPLVVSAPWRRQLRVARLRVWADTDYRAQNVRWQHGFSDQLDAANEVLAPMLGIRLEAEYRPWDRAASGARLDDSLAALAATDPGDDVVFVLGLTSSLSLVTPTFEQLGMAELGGRHVVMRGHADLEERKALERGFPDSDQAQRDEVLNARRRHKITTVLLHELAHSLGALHEQDEASLMNPGYSHLATTIGDHGLALMRITLEDRLLPAAQRDPAGTARRLLAALDDPAPSWPADERDDLRQRLTHGAGTTASAARTARPVPRPAGSATLPPAVLDEAHRAHQLLGRGQPRDALAVLEPLLAAYPAHAELRVLACRSELARGGARDTRAIEACDRAAELSPGIEPALEVARARIAAGDRAGARAILVAAEPRIERLTPTAARTAWLLLAQHYRALGAITWAEAALASAQVSADFAPGIAAWVATTRVRRGIPRDGARWQLTPQDEPAALEAVVDVMARSNADRFAAAAGAAAAAERRWPGLPGLLAARCDLEFRRGALAAARTYCDRAIAQGGSSWALYLRGVIELRGSGAAAQAAGIARLREAIALDPELGQAWRTLAKALERARATAELDQLRADYAAKFQSRLPR
jgi:hypothetical protein